MTEQQFKRWMTAKIRQYIWLIMKRDPNRYKIEYPKVFHNHHKKSHGLCSTSHGIIYYRTDYIKDGWDCDLKVLENLIIHEVCHLKYPGHDSSFFNIYKKWSGDDFIGRWYDGMMDDGHFTSHVVGLPPVGIK
jgi:predicted metal-dependent hydrolase